MHQIAVDRGERRDRQPGRPSPGGASTRRRARCLALGTLALLAVAGCRTAPPARRARPGYTERGVASWYGPGFHGHRTASGETYDMHQLTAAHRRLPFDTWVEVRDRDTGRKVQVRINDRGPFVHGRIIDLSYAAADALGMIGPGTARVEIRVVRPSNRRTPKVRYVVQVGAFQDRGKAELLLVELRAAFPREHIEIQSDATWHRVLVGPFDSPERAERQARELERQRFAAIVRVAPD